MLHLEEKCPTGMMSALLEGDETGRVSGTDTRTTVLHGFVGDGELAEVVANHFGFDFNLVESFSLVDTNDAADHLGHDDHVSQMRLDGIGFFIGKARLLALTQLLDKSHGLSLEAAGELATNPAGEQLHQLIGGHVKELVKIDASVGVLPEGSLLGLRVRHFETNLVLTLKQKNFKQIETTQL